MPSPYDYQLQLNGKFRKKIPEDDGTLDFAFQTPQDNKLYADAEKLASQLSPEQIKVPVSPNGIIGDDLYRSLTPAQINNLFQTHSGSAPFWGNDYIKSIANDGVQYIPTVDEKSFVLPVNTAQPTTPVENPSPTPQAQSEPMDSKQYVDNVTIPAAQNPQSYYDSIRQLSKGYRQADPYTQALMDMVIGAQGDYAKATTDAQRQQAHANAETARKLAIIGGYDLGLLASGDNLSPEQSNLAIMDATLNQIVERQNKFQAVQDNLKNNYSESSNDHFWRLYDEYRQQGYGDRQAAILAGRETRTYQQDRVIKWRDALNEYGIENGNTLNQFGANAVAAIAGEGEYGSNLANVTAQAFATPLQNYKDQQEMMRAVIGNQSAMERLLAQLRAQRENLVYTQGKIDDRTTQSNQTKLDVANTNRDGAAERQEKLFEHQWDLKKADQEFQIFMKEFEAALKGKKQNGAGQSSKASKEDYDKLRNMRSRYEKLYKDAVEASDTQSADEIKAKTDYIDKLLDYEEDPRYQYDWGDDDEANARSYLAAEKQGVTPEELKQWVQQHIPNKQAQHKFYDLVENIRKRWF